MAYNSYGGDAQYSTTSYNAQGGAGGGGFMNGSQSGSQQGASGKGTYGKDTLRPCTILQVLNASQPHPDADFSIDGVEITHVTFVGQIRNISTQATNITYKLDDGTGTIEVKQWIDTDASTLAMDVSDSKPKLLDNEWARVWGRLKAFSNKRHVGAHVIRPVVDKMEISYHLLEATYVHLHFTRGPPDQFNKTEGAENNNIYGQQQIENGDGGEMVNGKSLPPMSGPAKRVFQALRSTPQNNEGLHTQNIAALLGMGIGDVMKAGDELLSHGLIFTTVDDNTWAILDF